jgi:hypothetical protein
VLFPENYAGGVTPVVIANNILYHATEYYVTSYRWPQDFQAAVLSYDLSKTDLDEPLMNPKNWKKNFATSI